jgi:hypothetical protein
VVARRETGTPTPRVMTLTRASSTTPTTGA